MNGNITAKGCDDSSSHGARALSACHSSQVPPFVASGQLYFELDNAPQMPGRVQFVYLTVVNGQLLELVRAL